MTTCRKVACGECLPDYRYFINAAEEHQNTEQTIELYCPPGYDCTQPSITRHIPAGRRRWRWDIPEDDPDVDPECDDDYEGDDFGDDDGFDELQPQLRTVGNAEVTVDCEDLGLDPAGSASYTLPANTIRMTVPNVANIAGYQALVDAAARTKAMQILQEKIDADLETCDPFPRCGHAEDQLTSQRPYLVGWESIGWNNGGDCCTENWISIYAQSAFEGYLKHGYSTGPFCAWYASPEALWLGKAINPYLEKVTGGWRLMVRCWQDGVSLSCHVLGNLIWCGFLSTSNLTPEGRYDYNEISGLCGTIHFNSAPAYVDIELRIPPP